MVETTLTKKLLKFILPILVIPTIIIISFFYVYLMHIIEDDVVSMSKNLITQESVHFKHKSDEKKYVKNPNSNLPTITIIGKNLIIIDTQKENDIGKLYSKYKDILQKYIQETIRSNDISLFHNEKNDFLIKPLVGENNEIVAFALYEYHNILSKKITLATQTFIFVSIVIIIITFISVILTIIFAFNITNPIKLLIEGTKRVSNGDLFHSINISSDDEVGILVDSFNNMLNKIRLSTLVFDNSHEAIMITNSSGNIIDVNMAFSKITGYLKGDVIGKNTSIFKSGRHDKKFYEMFWSTLLTDGYWQGNIWNCKKSGDIYPQWINISTLKDENGEIKNFISIFSDITELKENEERLDTLAHHDSLTGLPNRLYMRIRLEHSLAVCKRLGSYAGICFLDLDNFKIINDTHGHEVGDEVLKEAAKRLQSLVRSDDTLARLGGDEFVLIFENIQAREEMSNIAQSIVDSIQKPFEIDGNQFQIGLSVGISIYPDDGETASLLLKNSDIAMYEAKNAGKSTFRYYKKEMEFV